MTDDQYRMKHQQAREQEANRVYTCSPDFLELMKKNIAMNNKDTTANSPEQVTDWLVNNYRATKNRPLHNTPPNSKDYENNPLNKCTCYVRIHERHYLLWDENLKHFSIAYKKEGDIKKEWNCVMIPKAVYSIEQARLVFDVCYNF